MPIKFANSYLALGSAFSQQCLPTPVSSPVLLLWNRPLASTLGFDLSADQDSELLAQYFSGNKGFEGSKPIAQAYSGHQFAHFNPQLGDGRAHLLGDVFDEQDKPWDVQLKGSGTSQFSRRGDGRCALGPALREFIMSEAMFAAGIPTTRCLAVVATGEAVYREQALPGAVVTRVAKSHIRVGTFQYFSARKDLDSLQQLTRYAIERHFPEIEVGDVKSSEAEQDIKDVVTSQQVLDFFAAVLAKQVNLITSWLRVGFIHGVMNTDNTAISGETIDYGPCAMMNHYHSGTVFSSIDRYARYAFGEQSKIMQWNMARLADCLLPLVDDNEDIALGKVSPLLQQFADNLKFAYFDMMTNKLGISDLIESDVDLVNDLLTIMQEKRLDYTQTFVSLAENISQAGVEEHLTKGKAQASDTNEADAWQQWLTRWYRRIVDDTTGAKTLMNKSNPLVIPRNHHVEDILATVYQTGDLTKLHQFIGVIQNPYQQTADTVLFQGAPVDGDENYHTFCGT